MEELDQEIQQEMGKSDARIKAEHDLCEKRVKRVIEKNKDAIKMLDSIQEAGCEFPQNFFTCAPCPNHISGGFRTPMNYEEGKMDDYVPNIVLCENHTVYREVVESTVIHELVHAFDQCTAKINWKNLKHHACTEIRASNMSGECGMMVEWMRGNFKFGGHKKECVKRRSSLSVASNPFLGSPSNSREEKIIMAREVVETVFDECYADTHPLPCDLGILKKGMMKRDLELKHSEDKIKQQLKNDSSNS